MTDSPLRSRIEFMVELARRLHTYGTAAPRLEEAVAGAGRPLGLDVQIWSSPTAIILTFADLARGDGYPEVTQVIRLEPGSVDLERLCEVDRIAEAVAQGELDIVAGHRALRDIRSGSSVTGTSLTILSFGVASGCVAVLLKTAWTGVLVAALLGLLIGAFSLYAGRRPRLAGAFEALSALAVTLLASAVAHFLAPIDVRPVVMSSLIVLLPGLALTQAVSELSTQHLVSGTARLAGAMTVLLKLTFGAVAGTQVAVLLGWPAPPVTALPVPGWTEWAAVVLAAWSFAVLFNAARRDYALVIFAVLTGYSATRFGGQQFGGEFGVFLAGLVVSVASNGYARWFNRPGAVLRVPGIILLVPGSVGFRSLSFVLERDVMLGLDTAFSLVALLVSLVAGLLFGALLIAPRRNL